MANVLVAAVLASATAAISPGLAQPDIGAGPPPLLDQLRELAPDVQRNVTPLDSGCPHASREATLLSSETPSISLQIVAYCFVDTVEGLAAPDHKRFLVVEGLLANRSDRNAIELAPLSDLMALQIGAGQTLRPTSDGPLFDHRALQPLDDRPFLAAFLVPDTELVHATLILESAPVVAAITLDAPPEMPSVSAGPIEVGSLAVSVLQVELASRIDTLAAPEGEYFVVVTLKVDSLVGQRVDFGLSGFTELESVDGDLHQPMEVSGSSEWFAGPSSVFPGHAVYGKIAFLLPDTTEPMSLAFSDAFGVHRLYLAAPNAGPQDQVVEAEGGILEDQDGIPDAQGGSPDDQGGSAHNEPGAGLAHLDRAGINIAHNLLGGRIVASSVYDGPYYDDWALRNLNDGYITGNSDATATARILLSDGFTTNEAPAFPVQFIVSFNQSRTATIQAFAIDARKGFFFDANNNRPAAMRVSYSVDGPEGPWIELPYDFLFGEFDRKRYYEFPEPLSAKSLKISVISSHAGQFVQLAEIEVYEIPESASYTSVVADLDRDIAKAGLGGGLIRFTSAANKELRGAGALVFDRLAGNHWEADAATLPQQFVFHFNGFKDALVDRIEVYAPPPRGGSGQATRIQVATTMAESPVESYETIGELTFSADRPNAVLRLATPVEARFVNLTVVESSGGPVTLGPVRIIEANEPGTPSVLELGPTPPEGDVLGPETAAPAEPEPNDSRDTAIELAPEIPASGVLSSADDVDFYQFTVPDDSAGVVDFELAGQPFIKTFLTLLDADGRELFTYDPSVAQAAERFTWTLAPGRYWVRLHQPRTSIALVIDDSGSMRGALGDVQSAALRFVNGRAPDEDMAIVEFGNASHVLHSFDDDPSIMAQTLSDQIGADESGTNLYDGVALGLDLLGDRQGNRALVLLSDGADFSSTLPYGELWDQLERSGVRLFIVALGDGMTVPTPWIGTTPRSMLDGWARATNGLFYYAPSSRDLAPVYESIALTIRNPAAYSVSVSIAEGDGTLQLVEVGEPVRGLAGPAGMMIILDASGSMRGDTVSGGTKMDVAKLVLRDLISSLPDELPVGVRVYGHRYPRDPAERSCEDTELIVPMAANNRDAIVRAVEGLQPQGQTPIGRSLRALQSDLETMGDDVGVVVVITDGIETCSPEPGDSDYPIDVVRELQDLGLAFRVNVVGFDVDDSDTRAFLAELAERGDGDFFAASGAVELRDALEESFKANFTVFDSNGGIVATSVVGAAPITLPVGHYRLVVEGAEPLVFSTDVMVATHTRVELRKQGQTIGVETRFGDLGELADEERAPLSTAALSDPESIAEVQRLLAAIGFDPGPADGIVGAQTIAAILSFQEEAGVSPDGVVSEYLLATLVEAATIANRAESPQLVPPPAIRPRVEPAAVPPLPPGNVIGTDVRVIDSALLSVDGANVPLAGLIGLSDAIAVSIVQGVLSRQQGFPLVCAPSQLPDLYGYFCLLQDGTELGLAILAAGGAMATDAAPDRFLEAETAAQVGGQGIW